MKISIIEAMHALKELRMEVHSEFGYDAGEIIYLYLEQQRQEQINKGTLIV